MSVGHENFHTFKSVFQLILFNFDLFVDYLSPFRTEPIQFLIDYWFLCPKSQSQIVRTERYLPGHVIIEHIVLCSVLAKK